MRAGTVGAVANALGVVAHPLIAPISAITGIAARNTFNKIANSEDRMRTVIEIARTTQDRSIGHPSPGTGIHEDQRLIMDLGPVPSLNLDDKNIASNSPDKASVGDFISVLFDYFKQSPQGNPDSVDSNNLSRSLAYNQRVKIMYGCLVGSFYRARIIAVFFFLPKIIKRVENRAPQRLLVVLNWLIKVRVFIMYFYGFLLLTNVLTIVNRIIVIMNNPLS